MLGLSLKSAWFMSHRIREAMRSGDFAPFGAEGGVVEVDETYIGHDKSIKPKGGKKGRRFGLTPHSGFRGDRLVERHPHLKSRASARLARLHAGLNYAFPPKNSFW
jgi:hypothetical protein